MEKDFRCRHTVTQENNQTANGSPGSPLSLVVFSFAPCFALIVIREYNIYTTMQRGH